MDTLALFNEFSLHTEWADSVVFSAIIGNKDAEQDESILLRLRHNHLVQKVFLDVWQDLPINPAETQSLDMAALAGFARDVHRNTRRFHETLNLTELDRMVDLPWSGMVSKNLGFDISKPTLAQTLVQVFAHSAYHRGQVVARLRELSMEPPMTDFIAWVWGNKPTPKWPEGI
ncbi:MAG: damage-inducible protein DinB [Chlorobiaceae bacterium]|nr:damage-inducible protein DinB [Chlorobiaceae bacterium]